MAYLTFERAGREPCRHELTRPLVIGRSAECDVFVPDPCLSRRHCVIEPADQAWTAWAVRDLESLNGTRVGAMYVNERILSDGDEVTVGDVRITFHAAGFVSNRPAVPEPLPAVDTSPTAMLPEDYAGPRPIPRAVMGVQPLMDDEEDGELAPLSDTEAMQRIHRAKTVETSVDWPKMIDEPDVRPEHRHNMGIVAGLVASAAALGTATAWVLSH